MERREIFWIEFILFLKIFSTLEWQIHFHLWILYFNFNISRDNLISRGILYKRYVVSLDGFWWRRKKYKSWYSKKVDWIVSNVNWFINLINFYHILNICHEYINIQYISAIKRIIFIETYISITLLTFIKIIFELLNQSLCKLKESINDKNDRWNTGGTNLLQYRFHWFHWNPTRHLMIFK